MKNENEMYYEYLGTTYDTIYRLLFKDFSKHLDSEQLKIIEKILPELEPEFWRRVLPTRSTWQYKYQDIMIICNDKAISLYKECTIPDFNEIRRILEPSIVKHDYYKTPIDKLVVNWKDKIYIPKAAITISNGYLNTVNPISYDKETSYEKEEPGFDLFAEI